MDRPAAADPGRRRHYASFYEGSAVADGRPLAIVHGNCQAESLRVVLDGTDLRTVRIPPAHELTADDLGPLRSLLGAADVVISQPIRTGYRGLPIGTGEVLAAAGGAQAVIVPVIRFCGLYPAQAIVRIPGAPSLVPPIAPYHDLRVLARCAGLRPGPAGSLARRLREIARGSLDELRRRERRHGAVAIADVFERPQFAQMRTINHPGNSVWLTLATRVRARLSLSGAVADPGRPLLDQIHAPREPEVIEALGLRDAACAEWRLDGRLIDTGEIRRAHLEWYAQHPEAVRAGLHRHAETIAALGWR